MSPGCRLTYERRNVDDGSVKWTHVLSVDSVDGGRVLYSSTFRDNRGKVMYSGPLHLQAECGSNGDVSVDLARSVAAVFLNYLPDRMVEWKPFLSVLPSAMVPGDSLPDADFTVRVAGLGFRVRVDSRTVLRTETLTTPAGEFDCIVVREHKTEKGLGRNRVTTALTWYSRGTGMVRHDTYDNRMELETSEVLTRIEME